MINAVENNDPTKTTSHRSLKKSFIYIIGEKEIIDELFYSMSEDNFAPPSLFKYKNSFGGNRT